MTEPTHSDIHHAIGRLEAKVDTLLDAQKSDAALHARQDARLGALEHWRTRMITLLGVIGAAAGALGALIADWIRRHLL